MPDRLPPTFTYYECSDCGIQITNYWDEWMHPHRDEDNDCTGLPVQVVYRREDGRLREAARVLSEQHLERLVYWACRHDALDDIEIEQCDAQVAWAQLAIHEMAAALAGEAET